MAPTARPGSKPGKIGRVVATLGCDIASGAFPVGAALPAEPDLERHYGASRGVVREAVKILAGKGLLSVGPRIGTRVRPTRDWNLLDHDVLAWLGRGGLDRELMLALDETRGIIEPAAASLAAERATAEDRRLIRQAYEDMAADPGDIAKATIADKAFHLAILDATHNPVLASFRTAIDAILTAIFDATVPMLAPNLPNHEAVALAIERGDAAGARLAMEQVLDRTHRLLTGERAPDRADINPSSPEAAGFTDHRSGALRILPPPCGEGRADAQRSTGVGVAPQKTRVPRTDTTPTRLGFAESALPTRGREGEAALSPQGVGTSPAEARR